MRDSLLDLFVGSRCAGCDLPGRLLCAHCASDLPRSGSPVWPEPAPHGLVLPYAAGWYEPPLRQLLIGLKERGQLALAVPLGRCLGLAVRDLVRGDGRSERPAPTTILVPVPSSASARRTRGHDHARQLARHAAGAARAQGLDVRVLPALRHQGRSRDQGGLTRSERQQNAHGRFRITASAAAVIRREAGRRDVEVVVVDDIMTTGETLREAQAALQERGLPVLGAAVVAAARRRVAAGLRGAVGPSPGGSGGP